MRDKKVLLSWILLSCAVLCGCGQRPGVTAVPEDTAPTAPGIYTPSPTATPVPGPGAPAAAAEELLANMTLGEKVGQLFMVRPDALDPRQTAAMVGDSHAEGVTEMSEGIGNMLVRYPVGGIVIFGKNVESPTQLYQMNIAFQKASKTPLFISVDEEGGSVTRLANQVTFNLPRYQSAAAVGASGDRRDAEDMGAVIGGYLSYYGFSMDFAPVADVNTNPDNPVIGRRAFSADAKEAAAMAGAMADGLASEGIIPVYKHFPGHGDTAEDSHMGIAVTYKYAEEMMECEWLPYLTNDLTGSAVMVGHIAAPNITGDMTPASLSRVMVTEYLRGTLGFQGLVITDALAMAGITDQYTSGEASVLALEAGCDILLMPAVFPDAYNAVLHAVETGEIPEERIDESVLRILEYKAGAGLMG